MANKPKKAEENQPNGSNIVAIAPLRLPYHGALKSLGCDQAKWRFLCESLYPSAQTIEGIAMALRYCQARNLDIMKKPVHVVPVYSTAQKKMVEMVWPGIGDYRTTAARTGEYGGCDQTEFGPDLEKEFTGAVAKWENGRKSGTETISVKVKFPEWARVTVYRFIKNHRVAFHGPKVFFEETYSTMGYECPVPNNKWQRSPSGMLEKCAEAAALRKAFPEEIGSEPTAEEMEGKVIEVSPSPVLPPVTEAQAAEMVDDHIKEIKHAEKAEQPKVPEPGPEDKNEPEAEEISVSDVDQDWVSKFESEIQPGIDQCTNGTDVMLFLAENEGMIREMPVPIRDRLDRLVHKKIESFSKAKK